MPARVINFAERKAAHPPALICWQHGLACWLAWQKLMLKVIYGPRLLLASTIGYDCDFEQLAPFLAGVAPDKYPLLKI